MSFEYVDMYTGEPEMTALFVAEGKNGDKLILRMDAALDQQGVERNLKMANKVMKSTAPLNYKVKKLRSLYLS